MSSPVFKCYSLMILVFLKLTLNGETLKEVNWAKYLGVLIDNKLIWKNKIDIIKLKVSKGIIY